MAPVNVDTLSPDQAQTASVPEIRSTPRKKTLQKITRYSLIALFFVLVASVLLLCLPKKKYDPLIPPEIDDFGIGFDLNPSYAYVPPLLVSSREGADRTPGL